MEGGSSNRPATGGAASVFLANLPSRGFLSSTVLSSNLGRMRVYVCDHDTSPPEGQQIKANLTNILIRSLQLKGHKGSSRSKDGKSTTTSDGPRKRFRSRSCTCSDRPGSSRCRKHGYLVPSSKRLRRLQANKVIVRRALSPPSRRLSFRRRNFRPSPSRLCNMSTS